MMLINGDCLEEMKKLDKDSIDLIFCDLPYGQTSCKWDCKIDLEKFWIEIMRIKKLNTPIFFTTTVKFGTELILSAPKKCFFRYDLVWVKSAPAGFLCAKKMPMRKHEMIYVFYEKLPFYDLSSHTHKFLKPNTPMSDKPDMYGRLWDKEGKPYIKEKQHSKYEPPLPVSVVKEKDNNNSEEQIYNKEYLEKKVDFKGRKGESRYDPPLPVSVVKEDLYGQTCDMKNNYEESKGMNKKERKEVRYDPPLPVSVVKEESKEGLAYKPSFSQKDNADNEYRKMGRKGGESAYDPPLPTSMLEVKSTRGKHSTEKPVALMEWIFKYYSKEGDTVFDPTMGSGSTCVACKNMNRKFIGIEKDPEIFKVAVERNEFIKV